MQALKQQLTNYVMHRKQFGTILWFTHGGMKSCDDNHHNYYTGLRLLRPVCFIYAMQDAGCQQYNILIDYLLLFPFILQKKFIILNNF